MTSATFDMPPRSSGTNLYRELGKLFRTFPERPSKLEINFGKLEFIPPPGVAFLGNMTRWFENMGTEVWFVDLDIENPAIKYLDDSLFFEHQGGGKLDPRSACRNTTHPLKNVTQPDAHGWLEFEFIPWLSERSGLSTVSLAEVSSCIKEVINNISDHTANDEGYVFAQWYPKINEIIISIADFGCGIRENVEKEIPECNDVDAILWATEEGNSSKSLPSNRGAGLHYLLLNIVLGFRGVVYITSQAGRVKFENRKGNLYKRVIGNEGEMSSGYCVGTSIDITIFTDNIPHADDEENFEWLF